MKNLLTATTHGINNILTASDSTIFEGNFHHNPFVVRFSRNSYQTLKYKEIDKTVRVDEDYTELIDFIRNPNILKSYHKGLSA